MTEARLFRIAVAVGPGACARRRVRPPRPGLGMGQHALAGFLALVAADRGRSRSRRCGRACGRCSRSRSAASRWSTALHVLHLEHGASGGDVTGVRPRSRASCWSASPSRSRGATAARAVDAPRGRRARRCWRSCSCSGRSRWVSWPRTSGASRSATRRAAATATVEFEAADGLGLAGWYRPSANGAAVLVVHGGSSDRKGSRATPRCSPATATACCSTTRADAARARAAEQLGWDWAKDVAGAMRFVEGRPDVEPGGSARSACRPARTPCSRSPASGPRPRRGRRRRSRRGLVRGLGAAARHRAGTVPGGSCSAPSGVLSGDPPGPPLEDLVARIDAPTLLVSAGTAEEREFNVRYERARQRRRDALEPARGAAHARAARVPAGLRAARRRLPRPRAGRRSKGSSGAD